MHNINTKEYWEKRFSSGNWETAQGRKQTRNFAESQIPYLHIPNDFEGKILDFGCGLGDAIPIYKKYFPKARLIGIDISSSAIEQCEEKYGHLASFIVGTYEDTPSVDIIIASNVFEHLSEDKKIAQALVQKCNTLYIIVPYKESPLCNEHIRSYDENHFTETIPIKNYHIFNSKGWSEYNLSLFKLFIKNSINIISGKPIISRRKQIIFNANNSI